jgi:DNA polymerase-3 subunit gamma/tau
VLPTIRSRTHHYPFRLIPPRTLSTYLSELCDKEGVRIDPAALPLVVRAGGGSARDTLSVLDQLLGGAGPDGVTYDVATGLLGYTPDTLLDEVVDAFAAADGSTVFGVVDKVIETGQDPRRFTEDVLRRLRDLVIIAAVPDASASGLIDVPEDQAERLVAQAARFGKSELVRAADLLAAGLTEMRGATAPRLLLEMICARVLLPGADHGTEGLAARLDRLERRVSIGGMPVLSSERSERGRRACPEHRAVPSSPPVVEPVETRTASWPSRHRRSSLSRPGQPPGGRAATGGRACRDPSGTVDLERPRPRRRPSDLARSARADQGPCVASPGCCSARTRRSWASRATCSRSGSRTPAPGSRSRAAAATRSCARR